MDKQIHIFTGHFGSGKTETALNFAVKSAVDGKRTAIADMDTVNPYFRAADARAIAEKFNIELIASEFAGSNVDIPIIPNDVMTIFQGKYDVAVIDVGGDGDGAVVLGRYRNELEKCGYLLHFVVNTKRPMTDSTAKILEYINDIECVTGLKVTDIINNTNLGKETDENTVMSDYDIILHTAEKKGIPILYNSGTKNALAKVNEKKFDMEIFIKMPWDD